MHIKEKFFFRATDFLTLMSIFFFLYRSTVILIINVCNTMTKSMIMILVYLLNPKILKVESTL